MSAFLSHAHILCMCNTRCNDNACRVIIQRRCMLSLVDAHFRWRRERGGGVVRERRAVAVSVYHFRFQCAHHIACIPKYLFVAIELMEWTRWFDDYHPEEFLFFSVVACASSLLLYHLSISISCSSVCPTAVYLNALTHPTINCCKLSFSHTCRPMYVRFIYFMYVLHVQYA